MSIVAHSRRSHEALRTCAFRTPEMMVTQDTPTECRSVVLQDGDLCHIFKLTCEDCVQRDLTVQLVSVHVASMDCVLQSVRSMELM